MFILAYVTQDDLELSAENEQKSEYQATTQNEEKTTIKQLHSEKATAEINHTNDTEEQEEVPTYNAKEELVIENEGKLDQEEPKQDEEATKSIYSNFTIVFT